ncbi:MAG: radical SAM protein [Alphaproteobacteria bacterium]|nr:radical SAM protein [Alphaproteobacteria bacterium]
MRRTTARETTTPPSLAHGRTGAGLQFARSISPRIGHRSQSPAYPRSSGNRQRRCLLKTRFCKAPFNWFETNPAGDLYACCPSFLPTSIGTLDDVERNGIEALRNGPISVKLRESILDGSFRYCSKMYCTHITNKTLMSREEGLKWLETAGAWPEQVMLAHDQSCNLSCPSCRKERIVIPKNEQDHFDALTGKVLIPLMAHAENVRITGSGDPFGGIHFRNLLKNYCRTTQDKKRTIVLQTNGILCDRRAWDDIGLHGHVKEVYVSIDASTEATYNIVRRGGDFARLKENMAFLSEFRHRREFNNLMQSFVVQARNFREMPDFVRMGLDWGADTIEFTLIRNWNTFSVEEFDMHNIASLNHPVHDAFLRMLDDPIFNHPSVNLSGIRHLRPAPPDIEEMTTDTPQRPPSNILLQLYILFLRTLVISTVMVAESASGLNNSESFYEVAKLQADILLQIGGWKDLVRFVRLGIDINNITQHARMFAGAVYAACAARAGELGCVHLAVQLANEALFCNPRDIFARSIANKTQQTDMSPSSKSTH